ncbi:hypothetical protein NDN08_005932 [Rhodosorus marinus]|uniref:Uncharacterized protein n=1 Tax=Rhodosorus marinus TaxID=101924 RepID=A0AAV8UMW5_9RHOD|nr:hypothetical protein NDN08_005932 [Rhodosorus marinus]
MRTIPLLLLGLMALGCSFGGAEAQNLEDEICVPLDTFEDLLDGLMGGVSLEWTNIGAYNEKKKNWIKQKSWVSLGALGQYKASQPVIKHKIGSKVYYEHISKWRVKKGGFKAEIIKHKKYQWAVLVTVKYESNGDEIIVKCYDKKTKKPCKNEKYDSKGQLDKTTAFIYASVSTKKNSPNIKLKPYHVDIEMKSKFGKKLLKKFGRRKEGWIGKNKKPLKKARELVLDYVADGGALSTFLDFDVNNLISGYLVDQDEYDVSSLLGLTDIPFAGLIDQNVLEKLKITQVTKKEKVVCLKYKLPLSALF